MKVSVYGARGSRLSVEGRPKRTENYSPITYENVRVEGAFKRQLKYIFFLKKKKKALFAKEVMQ